MEKLTDIEKLEIIRRAVKDPNLSDYAISIVVKMVVLPIRELTDQEIEYGQSLADWLWENLKATKG